MKFIEIIEQEIGKPAIKNFLPMQDGDVPETYADVTDLMREINFEPATPIEVGVANFVNWYKEYYNIKQ
jgi:UDP-glucuronate 4-epimerase